jgi:hypothetical protein
MAAVRRRTRLAGSRSTSSRGTVSAYDRRRDTKVRLAGCHVERVTDVAIDNHLDETVNDLWVLWQRLRGDLARKSAG